MRHLVSGGITCAVVAFGSFVSWPAAAIVPEAGPSTLAAREFFAPELSISTSHVPLSRIRTRLANRGAWDALAQSGASFDAYVDPRSGAATNVLESVPLMPGTGVGNRVTLADVGRRLGRAVTAVDAEVVAEAVLAHVRDRQAVLGIDPAQLGPVRASRVDPQLWQVSIPQRYRGVPVRHGRLVASIGYGNLVAIGVESWGDVSLPSVEPAVGDAAALEAGFAYVGGRSSSDVMVAAPALEIVPTAPPGYEAFERSTRPIGRGYAHRLVWTFTFERAPAPERWEVMVDAQSGAVLALQDTNLYAARQVVGGIYPSTSTGVCTVPQRCGQMQPRTPMPFVGVRFPELGPSASTSADSAGVYDYPGGLARTALSGRFVHINEGCPLPSTVQSADGRFDLGGANGDHDCDGQETGGDTAAGRTVYYEANRMGEIARGYLPGNSWVAEGHLTAAVNRDMGFDYCNAFWDGETISFYASGEGCRNAGEIASIVDHEWAHGLDQNDANGILSNSSEGYADIAAIYRTQDSCIGHGFFETRDFGCGPSADGAGFNVDEGKPGVSHCATDCAGARDADFAKHADQVPDTPANFVCGSCRNGSGPCGRETHCAAAPQIQAAWDLASRDLRAAPFFFDAQTAFLRANRLFYAGSGNVGLWYACDCGGSAPSSSGCGAGSGYEQWLVADDDNGSLLDGTPHMSAIFAAFARHRIACGTTTVPNSSCGAVAQGQPSLTVVPGLLHNRLTWTAVPGAVQYGVFRSDGVAGCDFGKAKIADSSATTFVDGQVATGRAYSYAVMAVGTNERCFSRASNCATATPTPSEGFAVSCTPPSVTPGPSAAVCTVQGTSGFTGTVNLGCVGLPNGVASCTFDPPTVTPLPGGPATSTLRIQLATSAQPGTYPFQVRGVAPPNFNGPTTPLTLTVGPPAGDLFATFDPELRAPSCGTLVGRSCDSRTLVAGRAGSEPNQPNAIGGCADGTAGSGSSDRIRVSAADGAPFAAGRKVVVEAFVTARAAFANDAADFFFAADAEHPVWQFAGSATPTASGPQTLSVGYKLPAGPRQAVRVQFRSGGTPDACAAGSQNDRDDLVFAVAP